MKAGTRVCVFSRSFGGVIMFFSRCVILIFISACLVGCAGIGLTGGGQKGYFGVPQSEFDPDESAKKEYVVGTVKFVEISEYQQIECEPGNLCHENPGWYVYDISGYFTSEKNEDENVYLRVAHHHLSRLYTGLPWFATLEKIENEKVRELIGADYKLVGVAFGYNVFCPKGDDVKLFDGWQALFKDLKEGGECYSF